MNKLKQSTKEKENWKNGATMGMEKNTMDKMETTKRRDEREKSSVIERLKRGQRTE